MNGKCDIQTGSRRGTVSEMQHTASRIYGKNGVLSIMVCVISKVWRIDV